MRGWLKIKEKFESLDSNKLSLTTLHKGLPTKYPETNYKLIDYIEFNLKLGLPITTWALLRKLYKLETKRKEMNIKANFYYIDSWNVIDIHLEVILILVKK